MKTTIIPGLIFGLGLLCACQKNKPTDDPEKLTSVLLAYFDGITHKDYKKMTESTTDDFVLYEMGRVWNNDSVFREMKKFPYTVAYKFDNFKINIDRMSGHMTYYNHADFAFDSTKQRFDWIESAAFRKTEDGWRMYFLHITERYQPQPPQK